MPANTFLYRIDFRSSADIRKSANITFLTASITRIHNHSIFCSADGFACKNIPPSPCLSFSRNGMNPCKPSELVLQVHEELRLGIRSEIFASMRRLETAMILLPWPNSSGRMVWFGFDIQRLPWIGPKPCLKNQVLRSADFIVAVTQNEGKIPRSGSNPCRSLQFGCYRSRQMLGNSRSTSEPCQMNLYFQRDFFRFSPIVGIRWKRRGARDPNSRQGNGLEIPKVLGREFLHIPHPHLIENLKGIERVNFEIIINLRMTKSEET